MKTVRLYDRNNEIISEETCITAEECNSIIASALSVADDEHGSVEVEDDDGRIWSPI